MKIYKKPNERVELTILAMKYVRPVKIGNSGQKIFATRPKFAVTKGFRSGAKKLGKTNNGST